MSLLPKSIHRCRRYPTKFNSGRDIPVRRRSSTRSYPSLETMTGNLGEFEADWWRPVSESSLLLTEPIHGVGAGRLHSVLTSTRCFSQSSGSG